MDEKVMREDISIIVDALHVRLGRMPTEDEVMDFIMSPVKQKRIWNGQSVSTD